MKENEWKKMNERMGEEWVNEGMNKKMNERMNERINVRMNERKKDGVVWIVDLKGKTRKERWVLPSCGFKSL